MSFARRVSLQQRRRLSTQFSEHSWGAPPSGTIYGGISALFEKNEVLLALAIRDSTYLVDFNQERLVLNEGNSVDRRVGDHILKRLHDWSEEHLEKFIGLAIPQHLAHLCPNLCSRLWSELDIIPLVLADDSKLDLGEELRYDFHKSVDWELRRIDEQAESMARKCVRLFGPETIPLLQVGLTGLVQVDTGFHVQLTNLHDFQKTVGPSTWKAVEYYALDLKKRKIKIAFFSATPQGGGVALMRHALVRFSHSLGTDIKWYVPKPRPGVFRITKTNHNILQGVSLPEERLTEEKWALVTQWIHENAKRYWLPPGCPLTHPSEGGADVIVVDDPQMPALIPLAKEIAPDRPVIFRCHIQVRSDLVAEEGSPQAEAWGRMWDQIKHADLFISHPVRSFVPHTVPREKVGYMPASTDWLDGLNKNMREWDTAYYGRVFNATVRNSGMPVIDYPADHYIVQIARFDPSKGIPDVVESYEKFYLLMKEAHPNKNPPKLLICGHGSVDDPDGAIIYNAVVTYIESSIPQIAEQISIVRLGPSDQVLNAIMSKARVALQLSTREGFEVKVSEAIHKGRPVIATRAGGIPLQVIDKKNGFLVDVGDTDAVARHLFDLCTDDELWHRMHKFALDHVCDEVSTVGNALNWLYIASKLSKGEKLKPSERWINDMAREEAGTPYAAGESRLKRAVEVSKMG
ncbi:putative trehalose synthase (Ccg-9) [Aspergillus rambellii]|uniref:Putative trehalose synthase (Ccg-9) n=1 Tax=Aspergillus rambellii TaxID=308745 RepID=A0A0F8V7B8_9EURO|nr:putative trehalose synthase (Ccg-9) [Aspergillus rambellii]